MNALHNARPRLRALAPWLLVAVLAAVTGLLPSIPQPPAYHDFADRSTCFGLPHCCDTASNALFVLAGLAGLFFLHGTAGRHAFIDRRERLPYTLFFFATLLVGLASGYYHLAPGNERLVWDRLAISLAFMSWFSALLCERISLTAGRHLLLWLAAAGAGSACYWGWSEAAGRGDLRAYGLMQILPLLLTPLLLRLYPPRYSGDKDIVVMLGLYLLALLFDVTDRPVFDLSGGLVSGHSVKHVIAALAAFWVVLRLRRRRIL